MTEQICRSIDVRYIHQHARSEGKPVKPVPISAHRGFGLGSTDQIIPRRLIHVPASCLDDFLVAQELGTHHNLHTTGK